MASSGAHGTGQIRKGIAPAWHTFVLIAVFVLLGIGGMTGSRLASPPKAVPFYLGAILFEWLLFAYVWWGIRLRRNSLAALVTRDPLARYGRDILVGIAIWLVWYLVESLIAFALTEGGVTNAGAQGTVFPHGPGQIGLWVLMAASSGFSEEIAFRGYFLQQFSAWTGSMTIGVVMQAILFAIGHAYLGVRQVLLIAVSGALLGVFAVRLRNIRPLMVTHAWADVFGGVILHGLPYR